MIQVVCKNCGAHIEAKNHKAGTTVHCPRCKGSIKIPGESIEATPVFEEMANTTGATTTATTTTKSTLTPTPELMPSLSRIEQHAKYIHYYAAATFWLSMLSGAIWVGIKFDSGLGFILAVAVMGVAVLSELYPKELTLKRSARRRVKPIGRRDK